MKAQIGITDDLADVFIIQTLKEGYCNSLGVNTQEQRNGHAEYLLHKTRFDKAAYREKFDRLSQLMIMYDEIELPILNNFYELNGRIEQVAKIRKDLPVWFYTTEQLDRDQLSDDDAMKLKPLIMSAIKNIKFRDYYIQYAIEHQGSVENLYSVVYDMMYNHKSGIFDDLLNMEASREYSMIVDNIQPDPNSPEYCAIYTQDVVISLVKKLILYFTLNKVCECDYYSKSFTNFSTETNVNAAYGMVKTQISHIMGKQPAFENLSEIMDFKKNKKRAIHDLREEISSLEELLKEGASETALQKAINDVRSANEALIKNSPAKRIAQIATYISVPISVVELLTFGTPFSMIIGVVGAMAQLKADMNCKQSDWLFVAK